MDTPEIFPTKKNTKINANFENVRYLTAQVKYYKLY